MKTETYNYDQAVFRNFGIVNHEDQKRLRNATVGIPSMGCVGGLHLMTLARLGVGAFHIADGEAFDATDLNRQYGALLPTLGQNKADVMCDLAKNVNPEIKIK